MRTCVNIRSTISCILSIILLDFLKLVQTFGTFVSEEYRHLIVTKEHGHKHVKLSNFHKKFNNYY